MAKTSLALVQMKISSHLKDNIDKAENFIQKAALSGAQIVLLPELFENHYFCQTEDDSHFSLAHEAHEHPFLSHFQRLAKQLGVILPISFFEKNNQCYFNSLAMIDAAGEISGIYRKSHIPDGPCYEEKFFFRPGNTGFKVWKTPVGCIGVGICWDQWFPECARIMALEGADLLLYPTAIGSEPPQAHSLNTKNMWQMSMLGHAIHNSTYVAAANRVGKEANMDFYGSSFVSNFMGEKIAELGEKEEGVIISQLNFDEARQFRAGMGFFRDRRPEHYQRLVLE